MPPKSWNKTIRTKCWT